MPSTVQKIDWNSVVKQMDADKKRIQAALCGKNKKKSGLDDVTFIHPFSVPSH